MGARGLLTGDRALWLLLLAFVLLASIGFGPYITDEHAFRQTQTALVARLIGDVGDLFRGDLPVLGPPWAVPFEFPLYQALAKALSVALGLRLEMAGRLVAMAAMLLCAWPLQRMTRLLGADRPAIVLAPVFLAPLYVFWSRAFLIETTALLFALLYLCLLLEMLAAEHADAWRVIGLAFCGSVAALVKVTTVFPLVLMGVAATAWWGVRWWRRQGPPSLPLRLALAHLAIAVSALLWLRHADAMKAAHPIAKALTSQALASWNYGTLSQRFDWFTWFRLVNTSTDMIAPLPRGLAALKVLLLAAWLSAFGYFLYRCSAMRRRQVLIMTGLFLLPFLIFTNLHVIHNYYQVANGVFVLAAFGLAAHGALEWQVQGRRAVLTVYAVSLAVLSLSSVWYFHFKSSHQGLQLLISAAVRAQTAPDEIIIISGDEWSPVIPYQAERRALMLPDFVTGSMLQHSAAAIRGAGLKVGAHVHCYPRTVDRRVEPLLANLGLEASAPVQQVGDCQLRLLRRTAPGGAAAPT